MTIYRFTNLENSFIAADGIGVFPANEDSYLYREMVEQGITPEPYDAGPPPPPPTTEEKVDQLLADYNLTRDELRAALTSTQEISES